MDKNLASKFLRGEFDPEYRKQGYGVKKLRARLNKPETIKVQLFPEELIQMRGKKPVVAKAQPPSESERIPVGVCFNSKSNTWIALMRKGKQYHLGTFSTKDEAHAARLHAEERVKQGLLPK